MDFAANSQCDPDDILIRYLDPQRTIEVLNPYGNQVVSMGTYGMRWQNDVLSVQYGTQNDGLFEVPLRMERGEQSWEINLMFGVNTYFFPHLPVGRGNGYGVEPRFQWTNPTGSLNETWTHLYTQTGAPMTVSVGETQEDEFDREVDAKLAEILDLDYDQPFQIGWGFTYARRPLQAQLVYRTYGLPQEEEGGGASPSGAPSQVVPEVIAEAGITASQLNTCHIIGVRKEGKSDTGVAIVNPTSKTATIRLTLKDREGEVVATRTGQLASMNQTVGFFHQLLEQELTAFSGTLTIFSDTTLAATALNTVGGLQSSSLVSATANDR